MGLPQGLTFSDGLVYGMRPTHPGLFEIKYHNPKRKNAISTITQKKFSQLVNGANEDEKVKVILVYGSRNVFSSGNDISKFMEVDTEEMEAVAREAVMVGVRDYIGSIMNSKKPTIMFVRCPRSMPWNDFYDLVKCRLYLLYRRCNFLDTIYEKFLESRRSKYFYFSRTVWY